MTPGFQERLCLRFSRCVLEEKSIKLTRIARITSIIREQVQLCRHLKNLDWSAHRNLHVIWIASTCRRWIHNAGKVKSLWVLWEEVKEESKLLVNFQNLKVSIHKFLLHKQVSCYLTQTAQILLWLVWLIYPKQLPKLIAQERVSLILDWQISAVQVPWLSKSRRLGKPPKASPEFWKKFHFLLILVLWLPEVWRKQLDQIGIWIKKEMRGNLAVPFLMIWIERKKQRSLPN